VTITVNGASQTVSIGANGLFNATITTSSLTTASSPYTITYDYNKSLTDPNFDAATNGSTSITVVKVAPTFSNLAASTSISYGTTSITVSGTIAAGSVYPPTTDKVQVTIGTTTISANIGANGGFSASFST